MSGTTAGATAALNTGATSYTPDTTSDAPRRLVLCFDGTDNKFNATERDSNIVKIYEMLNRNTKDQFHYYQPGIGTYQPGQLSNTKNNGFFRNTRDKISSKLDEMFGTSFVHHVLGGYQFILKFYSPGDKIYIFGFSRGAYTARFLSEMIDNIGLLSMGNEEMVQFAWDTFSNYQRLGGKLDDENLAYNDSDSEDEYDDENDVNSSYYTYFSGSTRSRSRSISRDRRSRSEERIRRSRSRERIRRSRSAERVRRSLSGSQSLSDPRERTRTSRSRSSYVKEDTQNQNLEEKPRDHNNENEWLGSKLPEVEVKNIIIPEPETANPQASSKEDAQSPKPEKNPVNYDSDDYYDKLKRKGMTKAEAPSGHITDAHTGSSSNHGRRRSRRSVGSDDDNRVEHMSFHSNDEREKRPQGSNNEDDLIDHRYDDYTKRDPTLPSGFAPNPIPGLDHNYGITEGSANLYSHGVKYDRKRKPKNQKKQEAYDFMQTFKSTFCRPGVRVHFLGLFDCVNSVATFNITKNQTPYIPCAPADHIRHALSLHERRAMFRPSLFLLKGQKKDKSVDTIKEVWFAGNHGDIGGGWWLAPEQKSGVMEKFLLSDIALKWMVAQVILVDKKVAAQNRHMPVNKLLWDENKVAWLTRHVHSQLSSWDLDKYRHNDGKKEFHSDLIQTSIHDCLKSKGGLTGFEVWYWRLMELLPFNRWEYIEDRTPDPWQSKWFPPNYGAARIIPDKARFHDSVDILVKNKLIPTPHTVQENTELWFVRLYKFALKKDIAATIVGSKEKEKPTSRRQRIRWEKDVFIR